MHTGATYSLVRGPVVLGDYVERILPSSRDIPTIERMHGSSSGLLSRLTAFAAWIFAAERLATDSPAPDAAARDSGDRAKSPGAFLRTLLATEALGPAPPPAAQPGRAGHARSNIVRWLFGREHLPSAPSPVDAARTASRPAGLRWLLSRESLAADEPAPAATGTPRGISLGWLLRRERLEPSSPHIGPHENPPFPRR